MFTQIEIQLALYLDGCWVERTSVDQWLDCTTVTYLMLRVEAMLNVLMFSVPACLPSLTVFIWDVLSLWHDSL